MSLAKNMDKIIGKSVSKKLSGKDSQRMLATHQKLPDHAKQSAANALKTTLKRVISKASEATGDLIGNKIANRITKVSRILSQNNSETITNGHDEEIPKERYISPEERDKIIDEETC